LCNASAYLLETPNESCNVLIKENSASYMWSEEYKIRHRYLKCLIYKAVV